MNLKMKKKNIVVIFGGTSAEYGVSLQSAYAVISNLDREKYHPVAVGISRQGNWYYFSGELSKIQKDTWQNDRDCIPTVLSPDRTNHRLMLIKETSVEYIEVDVVFPILHGKNGEDGTVQGLAELAGIPLAGCGVLSSALCMDKDRAHKMAELAGVCTPMSILLTGPIKPGREETASQVHLSRAKTFAEKVGYPFFVKPVKAGSSYGITRVEAGDQLLPAILKAFQYDDQVILEEGIEGFEVGCAVLGREELITGEVDEIELSGGFFDFSEKYSLKNSWIHVPARITAEKAQEIKESAKKIYRALDCACFARVDFFLTSKGEILFNEVNTIPGFTEHSRYPGMMKAKGYTFSRILDMILEQAMENTVNQLKQETEELK